VRLTTDRICSKKEVVLDREQGTRNKEQGTDASLLEKRESLSIHPSLPRTCDTAIKDTLLDLSGTSRSSGSTRLRMHTGLRMVNSVVEDCEDRVTSLVRATSFVPRREQSRRAQRAFLTS
jgi:hypothetical protein